MAALHSRCGHYVFILWFLLSIFYLFSSPNLSCRRLDVYHTSTHSANLGCRSETCCTRLAGNAGCKKLPKMRHLHIAQLYPAISSQLRHCQSQKNLFNSNISTCTHNMLNFGPLTAEICWWVWGTQANFNGFRILTGLLHGTLVVGGVEQRAPPIFGRATITLGSGPHSSSFLFSQY